MVGPDRLRQLRQRALGLLVNLTALGLATWYVRAPAASAVRLLPPPTATPSPSPTAVTLQVYVSGAVVAPDVVRLPEGARAREAVAAAGGFRAEADRAAVNLAAPLADGSQLHVPAVGEAPAVAAAGAGGPSGAATLGGAGGASGGPALGPAVGLVNLNRADAAALESLPGIGPALAQRIVAYRAEHGPFRDVQALTDVPGVGEKTLARFAAQLTVR
jgi:competence protein ComEA